MYNIPENRTIFYIHGIGSAKTTNLNKLRKEVEKCILVCSNCHKELHYPQNQIKDS